MVGKFIYVGLLSAGALLLQAEGSSAQESAPERYKNSAQRFSVGSRARGDYDSVGVRVGSYFLYPFVTESVTYDDNVFATKTNTSDDWALVSSPNLLMLSNWGRHQLDFKFGANDYRHNSFSSEDHTDAFVGSDWRIDVARDFNIAGTLNFGQFAEARGDSDAPTAAAKPVTFRKYDATVSLNKQFNRLTAQAGAGVEAYDYDDVAKLGGGKLDEDVRDLVTYSSVGRLAYEFSPGYRVFGLVQGNQRRYQHAQIEERDSQGIEGRAGIEFEVTHLIAGEISGGYLFQDYDNPAFADASGYALHGELIWNPTQLATVSLSADRKISETTVAGSSGHIDTVLGARVDYEILRNLIGSPYITYSIEDYQDVDREDKVLQTGLSLQLLLNRYSSVGAFYTYTTKDSTDNTYEYDKNVVGGMLKVQF